MAGALALLAAGGAAATFLVGGEQTAASATDGPQMSLAAAAQQLPVRTVKTITIKTNQKPKTAEAGPEPTTSKPKPVAVTPAAADAEAPLPPGDPRWARAAESQPIPANPPVDLTSPAMAAAMSALAAADEPSDPLTTAAIFRNEERSLEQAPPTKPELAVPAPQMPVSREGPAPTQTVRVNDGVNLRARAASGSRVLRTIPARAAVGLVGCKDWCEVVYEGTRGFVYKSFVGGSGAPARRAAAKAPGQAAPAETAADTASAAAPQVKPEPSPWERISGVER